MSKQIFTIMKLKDKDYLDLHKQFSNIKEEDLHNSLGFADREAGEIYVRETGIKDVDNNTILHEAEELFKETSPHEKNGIRFGWFKKAFGFSSQPAVNVAAPILAAMIPGVGPIISGLLAAATSAATQKLNTGKINPLQVGLSGVGGGILKAGMAPGIAASKEMGGGILGQVGSGLQSAVGIQSGAQKALTAGLGNTTGLAPGMITSGVVTPTTPNLTKIGMAEAARMGVDAGVGAGIGSTLGNVSNVAPSPNIPLSGGSPAGLNVSGVNAGAGLPGAAPAAAVPKTLIEQAKGLVNVPNVLGAASIAGSMAAPSPQFQMPSTVEDIRKKLLDEQQGGALTEIGKQARMELGNIMSAKPEELYPAGQDAYLQADLKRLRERKADTLKQLDSQYNLYGVAGSGEHLAEREKMDKYFSDLEQSVSSQWAENKFTLARTAKYQAVQDALNVDKADFDALLGLTGLDVAQASQLFNAKVADVEELRRALGTLGSELILRGTVGAGTQPTINLNMGR